MGAKQDKSAKRAKDYAQMERVKRIIEHFKNENEFLFSVEGLPVTPWPDAPFPNSICNAQCTVTLAGEVVQMTVKEMLGLHEIAACACGLEGCLSRGHQGARTDVSCDGAIARTALEFLLDEGLLR